MVFIFQAHEKTAEARLRMASMQMCQGMEKASPIQLPGMFIPLMLTLAPHTPSTGMAPCYCPSLGQATPMEVGSMTTALINGREQPSTPTYPVYPRAFPFLLLNAISV